MKAETDEKSLVGILRDHFSARPSAYFAAADAITAHLTRPLTEEEVERAARALTEAEITEWWGERCDAFEAACCVCQAWARHDIIAAMAEEDEHTRLEIERDRKERAALAAVGR